MNIELKYIITNSEELYYIYGCNLGSLLMAPNRTPDSDRYHQAIIDQIEQYIDPDLVQDLKNKLKGMVDHPEIITNYHLSKIDKEITDRLQEDFPDETKDL